jgi:hypothetical protein
VILLHQHGVEQAKAVVGPTAGGHRLLLKRPQPRRRLARVEHACSGAVELAGGARRERRDPRQPPEEVQGGALSGEQRTRLAADHEHDAPGFAPAGLHTLLLDDDLRIEGAEGFDRSREAVDHAVLLLRDRGAGERARRHRRLARHVSRADVLRQRVPYERGERRRVWLARPGAHDREAQSR